MEECTRPRPGARGLKTCFYPETFVQNESGLPESGRKGPANLEHTKKRALQERRERRGLKK